MSIRRIPLLLGLIAALSMPVLLTTNATANSIDPVVSHAVTEDADGQPLSDSDVQPMDANGCTTAPGPAGAHNCVVADGHNNIVTHAESKYYYAQPIGSNVCDRKHQFAYTTTSGVRKEPVVNAGGCVNPAAMIVTGDWVDLKTVPLTLQPGSSFCTRVNNTGTDHNWSSWACVTVGHP